MKINSGFGPWAVGTMHMGLEVLVPGESPIGEVAAIALDPGHSGCPLGEVLEEERVRGRRRNRERERNGTIGISMVRVRNRRRVSISTTRPSANSYGVPRGDE